MARIRTVKPEFWTSAQVLECSPNARLMFIGLFNFSDDCGRHPNNPKQIKAEIFPADDFSLLDVQAMIDELSSNGLITPYVVDNKEYFLINGWHHQRIDKPQLPKYPSPPEQFQEQSENDTGTIPPDRIGKDTIGKERESAPLPDGLNVPAWDRWIEYRKKAKLKPYKTNSTAENIAKYPLHVQEAAINNSINNEYQGAFPEKFADKKADVKEPKRLPEDKCF